MTIGTAFTLFVLPAIYVLIARVRRAPDAGEPEGAQLAPVPAMALDPSLGAAREAGIGT